MPTFTVIHETSLSTTDTFNKVRDYLENSEGLKKMDSDLKCQFDESGKTGTVKGSKFNCQLKITEGSKTKVSFEVSIPLLLTPFKSTIENTLKEKMNKILG